MAVTVDNWYYHVNPSILADAIVPSVALALQKQGVPDMMALALASYIKGDEYDNARSIVVQENNGINGDPFAMRLAAARRTDDHLHSPLADMEFRFRHDGFLKLQAVLAQVEIKLQSFARKMTQELHVADNLEDLVSMMNKRGPHGKPAHIWRGVNLQGLSGSIGKQ